MRIDKYLQRIERIDQQIRFKNTGTPKEFANKIGISERMLYHYLNIMKDLNGPIKYNRIRRSYYYEYDVMLIIKYSKIKDLNNSFH